MATRWNKHPTYQIKKGEHLWAAMRYHYEDKDKNPIFYVVPSNNCPPGGQYVGKAAEDSRVGRKTVLVNEDVFNETKS